MNVHRAISRSGRLASIPEVRKKTKGSECMAEFEQLCQQKGIHLFVLPPHSPKLNGQVERAHRTHTEEFYQVY